MHKRISILLFFLTLMIHWNAAAQQFPIRSYSIENGLSQSVVNAIYQTKDGYLWIGTEYGLNRYDGFEFENFYTEDGISNNHITSLLEVDDVFFIGTQRGITIFSQNEFRTWKPDEPIAQMAITNISQSPHGLLIATDGHGLFLYNEHSWRNISSENGLPSNRIHDIMVYGEAVWIATQNGLSVWENESVSEIPDLVGVALLVLGTTANKNILAGSGDGLFFVRMSDGSKEVSLFTTDDGLADNTIRSLTLDHQNGLWIGTENGISYYSDNEIRNYSEQQGLSNTFVISGFLDREHMMWFGTYGGGINLFPGRYAENFTIDNGLSGNVITSFAEFPDGRHWVGSFGGGITEFGPDGIRFYQRGDGLIDNRVFTLYKDSRHRVWVGTQNGISRYQNGEFVTIDESDAVAGGKVRAILETSDESFWIGTYGNGVVRFANDGISRITTENGLPNNIVMSVLEHSNGNLYLATYGGLVSRESNGNLHLFDTEHGLAHNSVLHLFEDDTQHLWVSTFRGITIKKGAQHRSITTRDGLPDHVCYFTIQDESGAYWIGTNRGISRVRFSNGDPLTGTIEIETFTTESLLVSNETNASAIFRDSQQRLWIGTVAGLTRLQPSLMSENRPSPIVHIRHMHVFERRYKPGSEIRLRHDENFLEFAFTGISMLMPSQLQFEYRLRGVDSQWNTTRQRMVRYTTLPHGSHTFQVRAIAPSGNRTSEISTIHFTIAAPFWLTWWFFVLMALIFSGLLYMLYLNYSVSRQVELERVRIRIASDLHDDVGASLTEIALQTDLLQALSQNDELQESVAQIGALSRNIVTTMDDIVWSIDARNDTLGDLTDRIQDYATSVLLSRNIGVSYDFSGLENVAKIPVEVRQNLYLIFKEAINNIAKHAEATEVSILLKKNAGRFYLKISDNGKGIDDKRRGGQGLKNMRMRAERIGAHIAFSNHHGTVIEITQNG